MGKIYTEAERSEAMKLASEIGNRAAAERPGIKLDTFYTWQSKVDYSVCASCVRCS